MKEKLELHTVANLKKILRTMKQDIGSYSKMKKAELVARILELKKKGFPVPEIEDPKINPFLKEVNKFVDKNLSINSTNTTKKQFKQIKESFDKIDNNAEKLGLDKDLRYLRPARKLDKILTKIEQVLFITEDKKKEDKKKEEERKKKAKEQKEQFDDEKKRILKLLDNPAFERIRGNAGYFTLRNDLKREIFFLDNNTNVRTVEGSLKSLKKKEKFIKDKIKEIQEEKTKTK